MSEEKKRPIWQRYLPVEGSVYACPKCYMDLPINNNVEECPKCGQELEWTIYEQEDSTKIVYPRD